MRYVARWWWWWCGGGVVTSGEGLGWVGFFVVVFG